MGGTTLAGPGGGVTMKQRGCPLVSHMTRQDDRSQDTRRPTSTMVTAKTENTNGVIGGKPISGGARE